MTLTLDLETLLNVTVYPLPKGTMWAKYEPICAKGKEFMPRTRILRQTEGQTDKYKVRAGRGPNNGACESV